MRIAPGYPGTALYMTDDHNYRDVESSAKKRFYDLVKKHIDETGQSEREADYAVALTPEGKALWEEARKADLSQG